MTRSSAKKNRVPGYAIPREMEEKILLNLPVKSLLRFRSVCKPWKSLITSKKFVKDHFQVSFHKSNSAFSDSKASSSVIVFNEEDDMTGRVSVLSIRDDYANSLEENHQPEIPGGKNKMRVTAFCCHCNGILCWVDWLGFDRQRLVFYNPALREHRRVMMIAGKGCDMSYGFGHDPKSNDYKFVRIIVEEERKVFKAEVYSLRTGRWRKFEIDLKVGELNDDGAVYFKGRLYWVDGEEGKLVTFDMADESFASLDLPVSDKNGAEEVELPGPWVMARGESLVYVVADDIDVFTAWVMMDGDGGWGKQFEMAGPLADLSMPMAFWKENEVLIYSYDKTDKATNFWSYSLVNRDCYRLELGLDHVPQLPTFSVYIQSLIPVKRYE